uniref:Uncharacterized protein n=1 Tax=Heliothis virescens TaxID=7102 RepID=A0A2A4IVW3_HELVI
MPRKCLRKIVRSMTEMSEHTVEYEELNGGSSMIKAVDKCGVNYLFSRLSAKGSRKVHIYNQAVLEALLSTSTSVLLDRVDPHSKESDFLGSGPPTVWKLPFRIDQLQYYDTSYMCDPSAKSNDTFASQYDSDHEQWDEPLKRRFSSAQTDASKTSASTQTLITVPFCRDPTQPVPVLPPDEPDKPTTAKSTRKDGPANRPAVYKKKPGQSPHSYYQPPEPWAGVRDDTDILEDAAPKLRKSSYSRSLYAIDNEAQDPIMELQAMAKSTNDMNEDDPPFNFQAMLKKTPRNRASMKRSNELNNELEERQMVSKHIISPSKAKPPAAPKYPAPTPPPGKPPPTPPGKRPAPTPPPTRMTTETPPPYRDNSPVPRSASREFVRQNSKDLIIAALKKRDSLTDMICPDDNKVENEKVEIAPGITVEGTVTDL